MRSQRKTHAKMIKIIQRMSWKSTYSNWKINRMNLKISPRGSHI